MKIVKLKGGLGNQMFQYIFAKYIEMLCDEKVLLDFSAYEGRKDDNVRKPWITEFRISLGKASDDDIKSICFFAHNGDMLKKTYKVFVGIEALFNKDYLFQKTRQIESINMKKYSYYDGYWQLWTYASRMNSVIREEFIPKKPLSKMAEMKVEDIKKRNAVFVGIRRGDYVNSRKNLKKYGFFGEAYYKDAMKIVSQKVESPQFYIFSNDIDWIKENMSFGSYDVIYNESNDFISDFEELIIMSKCKHAIICNSTYYWWAAWMIENSEKVVVAPKQWFADGKHMDIIPNEWIKM